MNMDKPQMARSTQAIPAAGLPWQARNSQNPSLANRQLSCFPLINRARQEAMQRKTHQGHNKDMTITSIGMNRREAC